MRRRVSMGVGGSGGGIAIYGAVAPRRVWLAKYSEYVQ